jgi:hypothetical protein
MPPGTTAGTSILPFAFLTVQALPVEEESRLRIAVSPYVEVQSNAAISVVVLIMVVLQQTLKHIVFLLFVVIWALNYISCKNTQDKILTKNTKLA